MVAGGEQGVHGQEDGFLGRGYQYLRGINLVVHAGNGVAELRQTL